MPRYVSKFKSIPDERVATDAMARAAAMEVLKVPENLPLCEEMLLCGLAREATEEKPYSTRAFRRAAIVLAEAPMALISKEGAEILHNNDRSIGMPHRGRTTKRAWQFVKGELLKRLLATQPMLVFPPEWRDGMLEDDVRLYAATNMLNQLLGGFPNPDAFSETDWTTYNYYTYYDTYELIVFLETITRMTGLVDEEDYASQIPGLLIPQ